MHHKAIEIINEKKTFEMFLNVNSGANLYACGVSMWRREKMRHSESS